MSTRAMILVQHGGAWAGPYHMYYRHCDGYPTGLGQELIDAMKKGLSTEAMIGEVCAEDTRATVSEPEDAFLKYQGDLEWIYVIRNPDSQESRSLEIFKTTCLGDIKRDFCFSVFWSYQRYMDSSEVISMKTVEYVSRTLLSGLAAAVKAMEAGSQPASANI